MIWALGALNTQASCAAGKGVNISLAFAISDIEKKSVPKAVVDVSVCRHSILMSVIIKYDLFTCQPDVSGNSWLR